ncbi:MAG: UDP-N-acetylmuramoyl-tripeptide--D-alanyl-D-alanine ligase, partial [Thiotrichales bacterium]|nr:UDP-N-acetylmuramoyl-tripeptide--D-alanyl-D-alanine ligase [Thiotrichales bacterium]
MSGTIQLTCLQRVADQLKVPLQGEDAPFQGVSSDSRSVQRGNLFVALNGPNFDGSRFLQMAQQRGAVGAIVQQQQPIDFPQIVVEDTLQALGQLAQAWRAQFTLPLLAITGSNGKTTVKEMAASILRQLGPGTVTQGNLNNEIGV